MRNLFKKSLAICLAIALCLTAMVGLTVSAEEAVPSEIVAENVTVKEGATSATFDVTFKAADLSEVMLTITTDATVDDITCVTNDNYELYYQGGNQFFFSTKKVDTTTETAINEATATITLTFEALAAATSFDVKIDLPEGYAATDKELLIAAATKTITVTAEDHTILYTNNENGTHTYDCTVCEYYDAVTESCTYPDGKCVCGAEEPVTGPVEDPSLADALSSTGAMMESTFGINFELYLPVANYGGDDFEFRVTKNEFDITNYTYKSELAATVYKAADSVGGSEAAQWGIYAFEHTFALYELQVPVTYSIHIFKEGKEISYYAFEPVTLTKVAVARYNGASSGSEEDTNVRKMVVALLNVGTKVQELFAAKPTTAEESPLKTFEAPNKDVDTVAYAVSYDTLQSSSVSKTGYISDIFLAVDAAPTVHIDIYGADLMDAADSFYIEASYFSKFENDTLEFNIPGTEISDYGWGIYAFDFTETFLFDTDKLVTLSIKKVDDDSVLGTAECTIDSLLLANVGETGLEGEAFRAIASLAAHCRVFYPNF